MLHSNIILFFVRQNGHFINSEDLIEIWDQAHYREREENIHRPLNSLMRFRIRKKYVYCWSTSKIFCHGNKIMSLLIFFWFWLIFSSSMSILYFMWRFPVLDVCIFYFRFPPPRNICPSGERPQHKLPERARETLKEWFSRHESNPYPSKQQREELCEETGLTDYQV